MSIVVEAFISTVTLKAVQPDGEHVVMHLAAEDAEEAARLLNAHFARRHREHKKIQA